MQEAAYGATLLLLLMLNGARVGIRSCTRHKLGYDKMKKILFALVMLLIGGTAFAQEKQNATEESNSKTLEFMKKDGTLIQREFYPLGKVKGVECEVLVITDLISKKKIGCMRLKTSYSSSYSSDTYIGTLDYDEIDACIKSINYINTSVINSKPEMYTEVEYKTRDKVEVGAFYQENKSNWRAYVQTKSYTNRSMEFFAASELTELASKMTQAKAIIEENTK